MKKLKYKLNIIVFVASTFLVVVGCDLDLQEEWQYEPEPLGNIPTGLTAYEWIQGINQDTTFNPTDSTSEFSFLLEAIDRTGMREEFDDLNDQRTFFLLRNAAWTGGGQILQDVAGSPDFPLDSIDTETLTAILNYHIIPDEVLDQGPSIPKTDFHFYYQTMIPGDTGVIEINKRLWDFTLRINTSIDRIGLSDIPSNMPSTSEGAIVALHNYQFLNGVGHQLNAYVRYQPF
ncbi:MAG: fasciclin domain-containing protein [Bacteroidota bacterium]